MELTQQVRDIEATAATAAAAAAREGMDEKSREFRRKGSAIYLRQDVSAEAPPAPERSE
jgi:hypothetical protein